MLLRVAIPILNGDFHVGEDGVTPVIADQSFIVQRREPVPDGAEGRAGA
jgi:hypothetical protein